MTPEFENAVQQYALAEIHQRVGELELLNISLRVRVRLMSQHMTEPETPPRPEPTLSPTVESEGKPRPEA